MFVGRERELKKLNELFDKNKASLVVCRGRRRIGKSTLIQKFGSNAKKFFEFQGLPPRTGLTNAIQLESFSEQLVKNTNLSKIRFENWFQAFSLLAEIIKNEKTVILFDEISWLGGYDKDFPGHLKIAWDTLFKNIPKLVIVLCGSVSSWIEDNILQNTGFMGRISTEIILQELPLYYCNLFWGNKKTRISSIEKLKILSITGGVPKYLEEININISSEENIKRLAFSKEGILFSEFEKIFNQIISNRGNLYKIILESLVDGSKTLNEICLIIGVKRSGHMTKYLNDLKLSGFISEDFIYSLSTKKKKRSSKYRLKDNYIRFYLKFVRPIKDRIEKNLYINTPIENLIKWDSIVGLQFENLVNNNLNSILKILKISEASIISASPYFQKKTAKKESCQIDLLIHTKYSVYVCEIKVRNKILINVIDEVKEKIRILDIPKSLSVRTVLIYEGNLSSNISKEDYFNFLIPFSALLVS